MAIPTMRSVPANANTRTSAVRQSLLALCPDAIGKITESDATAHFNDTAAIHLNAVKRLKDYHHGSILATRSKVGVRVTTSFCLDLDASLPSTNYRVLDMAIGSRENNNGWCMGQAEIIRLDQIGPTGIGCHLVGHTLAV